jgi:hypothetical protein
VEEEEEGLEIPSISSRTCSGTIAEEALSSTLAVVVSITRMEVLIDVADIEARVPLVPVVAFLVVEAFLEEVEAFLEEEGDSNLCLVVAGVEEVTLDRPHPSRYTGRPMASLSSRPLLIPSLLIHHPIRRTVTSSSCGSYTSTPLLLVRTQQ